jgi:hypothetical protein
MLGGRRYIVGRNHHEAENDTTDRGASIVAALNGSSSGATRRSSAMSATRRYVKRISEEHFEIDPAA